VKEFAHIRSIQLDKNNRVVKATISTSEGIMHVHWADVCGDWCWFTTDAFPARPPGLSLIPRIEEMGRMLAA
jgi:hypothetical protein